jgi:large subunit ribosomal protein L2
MGKRIIQQARGKGGPRYRVRKRTFRYKLSYPIEEGKGKVIALINSPVHTCPIARVKLNEKIFYVPAFQGMIEGQEITLGEGEIKEGNILRLKNIPSGSQVYHIELKRGDGGKLIRSSGSSATISKKLPGRVAILMPSKKEILVDENCKATIGRIAGQGRLDKPIMKAGKKYYMMKVKGGRVWPRTSAVKMNVVDHPFGSGRGKRIKSKIPKRNAPPGAKVGTLRPRRTGRRKR